MKPGDPPGRFGRGPFRSVRLDRVLRIYDKIPLRAQLVPIILAFVCSYMLYGRIAGKIEIGLSAFGGLLTFILLFAQMRLIDDLDDLEHDLPGDQESSRRRRGFRRRGLLIGLLACIAGIIALNVGHPESLLAALLATAVNYAAPFGVKRHTRSLAFGFIVYEGAPALIFAYVYFFWRDSLNAAALGPAVVVAVVSVFWAGYEFWKFSRKVHSDAMQPYLLSTGGIRRSLTAFLGFAAAANLALYRAADLSGAFAAYSFLLPVAGLFWLNLSWPKAEVPRGRKLKRPGWAGMRYVFALEAGVLLELISIGLWQ